MRVAIPSTPDFRENSKHAFTRNTLPCVVCGKPVHLENGLSQYMLHCVEGIEIAVKDEPVDPDADMGLYPIGASCLLKNPQLRPYLEATS